MASLVLAAMVKVAREAMVEQESSY